ncbi:PREDICTED: uncharacterized protein LOC108560886 isoform X2 [Nicrophorus vespilloides]|uniref:Uncharacterized protein LOC108560886 isoform X2 n=1 Tax=Nicrophorus vespilloides TaxID=110193 RepID=A0ABM1MHN6_NICVS|nr:PREDICTED: uncharacterized protein LOC108560886 isoform X2 [Nicrophorus vespilloides]
MWRLCAIILFCFTINFVTSLECYMCMASLSSDCTDANPKSKVIQPCIAAENLTNIEPFCVTAIAGDSPAMGRNFLRGCGYIYSGQDICKYLCNLDLLPTAWNNNNEI